MSNFSHLVDQMMSNHQEVTVDAIGIQSGRLSTKFVQLFMATNGKKEWKCFGQGNIKFIKEDGKRGFFFEVSETKVFVCHSLRLM